MNLGWWLLIAFGILAVLGAVLTWRPLRHWLAEVQTERAREMFALQRERLELKFVELAAASGKPRGLRWKDCDWASAVQFVRDRGTGQIAALVGVTISFEAIEGSDMENWSEVDRLRNATGVFYFTRGQWDTNGRAIFNMNPDEALAHFKEQYVRVER